MNSMEQYEKGIKHKLESCFKYLPKGNLTILIFGEVEAYDFEEAEGK